LEVEEEGAEDWPCRKLCIAARRGPIQEGLGEPVQEGVGEPFQKVAGEPFQEGLGEPVQEGVGEAFQKVAGEPFQEGEGEPVQEVGGEPVQEGVGEPVQEGGAELVQEVVGEPIHESEGEPVQEGEDKLVQDGEGVGEPIQDLGSIGDVVPNDNDNNKNSTRMSKIKSLLRRYDRTASMEAILNPTKNSKTIAHCARFKCGGCRQCDGPDGRLKHGGSVGDFCTDDTCTDDCCGDDCCTGQKPVTEWHSACGGDGMEKAQGCLPECAAECSEDSSADCSAQCPECFREYSPECSPECDPECPGLECDCAVSGEPCGIIDESSLDSQAATTRDEGTFFCTDDCCTGRCGGDCCTVKGPEDDPEDMDTEEMRVKEWPRSSFDDWPELELEEKMLQTADHLGKKTEELMQRCGIADSSTNMVQLYRNSNRRESAEYNRNDCNANERQRVGKLNQSEVKRIQKFKDDPDPQPVGKDELRQVCAKVKRETDKHQDKNQDKDNDMNMNTSKNKNDNSKDLDDSVSSKKGPEKKDDKSKKETKK